MKTKQEWMNLVRGSTQGLTSEQLVDVAMSCFEKDQAGQSPAIWHETSLICKSRCHCAKCHPIKGAFRYHHVA